MKKIGLGKTALEITRLGLGSAPLGGLFAPVSDADAEAAIEHAWSLGVRYYDTAPLYGFGLAERRMGSFLRGKPRESFVLSTKVGRLLRTRDTPPAEDRHYKGTPSERPKSDYSHDGVMRSVEESLERLGLDRVDILLVHDPDRHFDAAVAGAFRALERLRGEGTVRAIGAGMNQCEMLQRFAEIVPVDCFLLAGRYTLLDQSAIDSLFPFCRAKDIGILLGGIYNSGILAAPKPGATFNYEAADPALVVRAQEFDALARAHGTELKAAAIQFGLAHPAVTCIVQGARNASEVAENVAMAGLSVPASFWRAVRERKLLDPRTPLPGDPAHFSR
jgi:D-threo-aldose 1-dehydrogenase